MSGYGFYMKLIPLENFKSAPVSAFQHAPLAPDFEGNIGENLLVEVAHELETGETAHWLAIVVSKAGYFVQLAWFGVEDEDPSRSFWRHIAIFEKRPASKIDPRVFPVGWAILNKKRFEPPRDVWDSRLDWARFLETALVGKKVLPRDFHDTVKEHNETRFKRGVEVEATAIDELSALKPAVVEGDIGRRIMFRYLDGSRIPKFCWFHEFSEMFVPCGWAHLHGRELLVETRERLGLPDIKKISLDDVSDDQACIFDFKPLLVPRSIEKALDTHRIDVNMKIEVVDPSDPRFVNVGTIVEILDNLYLVVRIDGVFAPDGSERRVRLHVTSPYLLPADFAAENQLSAYFRPPSADFSYENTETAPRELLKKLIRTNGFERNQFLEVADWGTDRMHIGRILRVIGHLLLIHIEGVDSREDLFFPMSSSDLYPIGWCELTGHALRTPLPNSRAVRDNNRGACDHRNVRRGL